MLSVVIPSYNEEDNIPAAAKEITAVLEKENINCELIFVDDGSRDGSWDKIISLNRLDKRIRGVKFSRNFGKEGAILAGLEAAKGEAAVVIDCDLQHPPEKIPEMYRLWQGGAKVVEGRKSSRGDESLAYGSLSKVFYGLIQSTSKIDMRDASDFKLIDRRVIDNILALPERITFFRALSGWVGFESATVYYDVAARHAGKRRWTTGKLIGYAIRNLTSFTGILGMSSYYISRIYEEVKHRPRYIVSRTTED